MGYSADKICENPQVLTSGALANRYGVTVMVDDPELVDDPTGDSLDALLCAVQAAWAWRNRGQLFGGPPPGIDPREGWIADPGALDPTGEHWLMPHSDSATS